MDMPLIAGSVELLIPGKLQVSISSKTVRGMINLLLVLIEFQDKGGKKGAIAPYPEDLLCDLCSAVQESLAVKVKK